MPLLLAAFALAADASTDTVTLRFDPAIAGVERPHRCVHDRERRTGPKERTIHAELRVVPTLEPAGKWWAQGVEDLEIQTMTVEPPPPPGSFTPEAVLTSIQSAMPRYLVDARGRWKGVEEIDPDALTDAFTKAFADAGAPPEMAERMRPALAQITGPETVEASLRESWYATLGHWVGRKHPVGRSVIAEAKKGPFPAGTLLTSSVAAAVPCGADGAPTCVQLRLEARLPEAATREETMRGMVAVAGAAGLDVGAIEFVSGSAVRTWTHVVDPASMQVWRTERRRVDDAELRINGQTLLSASRDVHACEAL